MNRDASANRLTGLVVQAVVLAAPISFSVNCSRPAPPAGSPAPVVTMANAESRIASALRSLLQRSTDVDDCFVIVEDSRTGKFVQFTGSANEPLVLDLPTVALSAEELAHARAIFSQVPGSTEVESSFRVRFDQNVREAAQVAVRVLREVYYLGDNSEVKLIEE